MPHRPELRPARPVGGVAQQRPAVFVEGLADAFEPVHRAVALEGQNVRRHAVQELLRHVQRRASAAGL